MCLAYAENEQDVSSFHPLYKKPRKHLYLVKNTDKQKDESDEAYRSRLETVKQIHIKQARVDPNAFIEYCFDDEDGVPFQQSWFHEEWHKAMSVEKRLIIVSPRSHGKTSQIVGRVIWELGRNPNLRIKIVCAADGRAIERLFEIIQHIESNPRVREVFPDLQPGNRGDWSKHKIVVRRTARHRDASVEALGIGSTATGGRCDLLIADDVCDRRNSLQFPALRKTNKNSWYSDWTQLLVPDARVIYICTLWHKADLSHELLKNKAYTSLKFNVTEDMRVIWPEVWSRPRLVMRRREIGPTEFDRAFRNIAQDSSEAPIQPGWIKYFDPANIDASHIKWVLSYDLAYGQKAHHDYFACTVFAVDTLRKKVYVFDSYRTRISAPEQERRIVAEWKQYGADAVVIETVGGQESLAQYLEANTPQMRVVRHKPTTDKVARMNRVAPYIAHGMVNFHKDMDTENIIDEERGDLVANILDFPLAENDDESDAFSQGLFFIAQYYLDWDEDSTGATIIRVNGGLKPLHDEPEEWRRSVDSLNIAEPTSLGKGYFVRDMGGNDTLLAGY